MANVQMATVHRQATFETNRLKLQRDSLDLPVIDSSEDDLKKLPVKETKDSINKKKASESLHKDKKGISDAKTANQNTSVHNVKTLKQVPNSKKDVDKTIVIKTNNSKQEQNQNIETKPKLHAPKSEQIDISSQAHSKRTGVKTVSDSKPNEDNNSSKVNAVRVNNCQTTGLNNLNVNNKDKSAKAAETKQTANFEPKKEITTEPKRAVKKESVLSKLNANKTGKFETSEKQEEHPSVKQNYKPQGKEIDVNSVENKIKQPHVRDKVKTSPRKDVPKEDIPSKSKAKVEVVGAQREPPSVSKKTNATLDTSKGKESENKSENKRNIQHKLESVNNVSEKQNQPSVNKTSVLKGLNAKRDKSPDKKPPAQQAVESIEPFVKLPPKSVPKPADLKNVESNRSNNNVEAQKTKLVTNDKVKNDQSSQKDIKAPTTDHTEDKRNSSENKIDKNSRQNKVSIIHTDQNIRHTIKENEFSTEISPRTVEKLDESTYQEIIGTDLPLNKAPVGTKLNVPDKTSAKESGDSPESEVDSIEEISAIDNEMSRHQRNPVSENPLVEGITIEQRERKMEGRRHESYEALYGERNTLLKAEVAYKKRIKQLEDEANGFLKVIEDLTHENRSQRKKIDMLEDELNADGKTNFVERIEEMEEQNRALKNVIKEQKEVIAQLQHSNSNNDQQVEVRELKLQIVQLQTANQTQNEENGKLKEMYDDAIKKLNGFAAESKSKGNMNSEVLGDKTSVKKLQNENADLRKKVDNLEYENSALSESLAQKKTELKEILGVMKDENKFDNEIKVLKGEVLQLKKDKREMELEHKREKREISEKLNEQTNLLANKTSQYDETKIKADELENENQNFKVNKDKMEKDMINLTDETERLRQEVERLKTELKESRERYNKLFSETESASKDLKETKNELEQFNRDLQAIVTDKESQLSKLIAQLDNIRQEKEAEKKRATGEIDSLSKENDRLKVFESNYLKKEKELQACQEKLEDSDLKRKQLSIGLEDKGFEVSNLQQQIFELNMKLDNYSKRMSQLDKDKRELEVDRREWEIKRDKVGDIESSNKRLIEENKRLRNQLDITSLTTENKNVETIEEKSKAPTEAWVAEKTNQQAMYVHKERSKKKVHIIAEHSVPRKRQGYTKSSPVRSNKHSRAKREVIKVGLNSSRSLEDIRKTPERRGTPDSQPSLPEVNGSTRLTYGVLGGYSEIHRNRLRAVANKRAY